MADSLPHGTVERLRATLSDRERPSAIEALLDGGAGESLLGQPLIAEMVESALLHFDGERYRLLAWVVMPNHVHAVVEPSIPLADLMHGWKSFTAKAINARLGRQGRVWQPDYFDRFIRDDAHLERTVHYVEGNPVKAGLCGHAVGWRWSSAYWRDG